MTSPLRRKPPTTVRNILSARAVERPAIAGPVPALAEDGQGSSAWSLNRVRESGFADWIHRSSVLGLVLLGIAVVPAATTAASPATAPAAAAAEQGALLKWTRPRAARPASASPVTARTDRPLPASVNPPSGPSRAAAVASRAAQAARDTQARMSQARNTRSSSASEVVRASHEEPVATEPDGFPQTLVPPANAMPLLPAKAAAAAREGEFGGRHIDPAVEPEAVEAEPVIVADDHAVYEETDSTLREMMDAVAATATTELQMASRLQPAGEADLERPADLPGDSEPATDAMLQDVFGAEGEAVEGANDGPPPAPSMPSEASEGLPPNAAGAGGFSERATPSDGPGPGQEEAMLDPGDFVPQGSQPGDAEPPADRQPGDEVVDFNGRDCARERHMLQSAWYEMRQTPLHSISLDITPSLEPTGTAEEAEKARIENMERAPARVWHDKDGQVMARGKMVDFKNSQVIVQDESGQQKHLSWYQLGNDELCFVSSWWELPTDATAENAKFAGRHWTPLTMTWVASALCHKPLYFEDVQLERYGHSAKPVRQAALSGVHFFGSIFLLPYNMGMNPPTECQYALGYYRPGSCAPWLVPAFPWSGRGARMQAGALSGAILWYP